MVSTDPGKPTTGVWGFPSVESIGRAPEAKSILVFRYALQTRGKFVHFLSYNL